jgi:hypothetical protein
MKEFNTSGPNIPARHYTLQRLDYIEKGKKYVLNERYFTIWAPRQTGKSTYFRQLATDLIQYEYEIAHINFENYKDESLSVFLLKLSDELNHFWGVNFSGKGIAEIFHAIEKIKNRKLILILDEIEGINAEYFGSFLHAIRSAYHSRESHSLKSVILVGVTNIVGVVADNASPFNITENMNIPYFSRKESFDLLKMHEDETGQLFEEKVKEKIYEITAGQPGLVNGFANQLVTRYEQEKLLTYEHYLQIEHWYLNVAIDKNVANILNKAAEFRPLVENLLFTENKIPFKIDREAIKVLHTNGILKQDEDGNVAFWVPLYKKRLYDAFYPYTNGEKDRISRDAIENEYITTDGKLKIDNLMSHFKAYINKRGFEPFRERTGEEDEYGNPIYKSIPEAAMIYAFETYLQGILTAISGKSYREAQTALGRTDLLVNVRNQELLVESKIFYGLEAFRTGKKQLAYYCKHLGLEKGIYLLFIPEHTLKIHHENVGESHEFVEGIEIYTYLVEYEEEIPDYRKKRKKKKKV